MKRFINTVAGSVLAVTLAPQVAWAGDTTSSGFLAAAVETRMEENGLLQMALKDKEEKRL